MEILKELSLENPIRKIVLYKSSEYTMVYEVGRLYGSGRMIVSTIEAEDKGDRVVYHVFVNKRNEDNDFDTADYLWKTETSLEISVEYDLNFDSIEI